MTSNLFQAIDRNLSWKDKSEATKLTVKTECSNPLRDEIQKSESHRESEPFGDNK